MTVSGSGWTRTVNADLDDWFNTLVISVDNNSQFLTKLTLTGNSVDGQSFGDLSATDYHTDNFDGIAITFVNDGPGTMEDFLYTGTFQQDSGFIGVIGDGFNINVDVMQVVPEPGTNPSPPVAMLVGVSGTVINVSWSATNGVNWYVEDSSDLSSNSWTEVAGPLTASNNVVTFSHITTAMKRFFRLINK